MTTPPLMFGEHGELTKETIRAAKLTKEEKRRAYQMLEVQSAYLEILDTLSFPVDPDGHVHDLTLLPMPVKIAMAWTLALRGARFSGEQYIKKAPIKGAAYADVHTWVDSRAPDDMPQEKMGEYQLPPETKRLSPEMTDPNPQDWHIKPKIVEKFAPRPEE